MYPNPFEYHRATTLENAIELLQQYGDEAKIVAGGHSLLPTMKLRLANPEHLVDIAGIAGLSGVTEDGDNLVIGAMTTHRAVAENPLLQQYAPVLSAIAQTIGDRQVRNRGTIGGAIAHADPAADYPAGIVALDAEIISVGPDGERVTPASDFFISIFTTALSPDDVLTAIRIPKATAGTGMAYEKLANQASGYAMVGVAAVADRAFRAEAAEAALTGKALDSAAVTAATKDISGNNDVLSDIHASETYRRRVADGLAARAVLNAAKAAAR